MQFSKFLREHLASGGFTTEDVLASFLPLMRQTVEIHGRSGVAPLEGVDALHVESGRIWFEEAAIQPSRDNRKRVELLQRQAQTGVEIHQEVRVSGNEKDEALSVEDVSVGSLDAELSRPVYLRGYVAWEHQLNHHDPLTDTFSLGMILASLACGLDFHEERDLGEFVVGRDNLFRLNAGIHPVLARIIVRMTALNCHRRPQDLSSVLRALENYRDQPVDFELELAGAADKSTSRAEKQRVVLTKLQERLFEVSQRNRLLHFRPTLLTANLTQASIPLSFHPERIRPDQVLVSGVHKRDYSIWRLVSDSFVASTAVMAHVEWLLSLLVTHSTRIEKLRAMGDFETVIQVSTGSESSEGGVSLSNTVLRQLCECSDRVDIRVYCFIPNE